MIKKLNLLILILFCFVIGGIYSQDNKNQDYQPPLRSDYVTGVVTDDRFHVTEFNYSRRYSPEGKGEILEIVFIINNISEKPIDLKMFLLGFLEKNQVDENYRKLVPYPTWRSRDLDKENIGITLLDSLPKIDPSLVTKKYYNTSSGYKKLNYAYAGFLPYLNYIDKNFEVGIPLKVLYLEGGFVEDVKGYKLIGNKLKTTVTAEFFLPYKTKSDFFNHLGVVLYDTQLKRAVYRQFYKLKYSPKIY